MKKICFPRYKQGEFDSLDRAIKSFGAETNSRARLGLRDIVLYTPCYREHMRRYGVESLIERLIDEAPQIKSEPVLLYRLRRWAEECPLADYDIRCYNIKDKVTILGHTFNGLKDVRKHIESIWCQNEKILPLGPSIGRRVCQGVHVGCYFERYSMWLPPHDGDARICQSYIFRSNPVTVNDMKDVLCVPHEIDSLKNEESINIEWLPLLYYPGEGDYMFFATNNTEW